VLPAPPAAPAAPPAKPAPAATANGGDMANRVGTMEDRLARMEELLRAAIQR
jgi:hypothetical protein